MTTILTDVLVVGAGLAGERAIECVSEDIHRPDIAGSYSYAHIIKISNSIIPDTNVHSCTFSLDESLVHPLTSLS